MGTFVSCNWPRQTSKEGHLKRTSKAWVTELWRRGRQRKAQLQTQQLKLDCKSHKQNWPLECITFIHETMLSPGPPNMLNPANKNQYSCPTSDYSLWSWCFTNRYSHVHWDSRKGYWVGSQPTWVLGLALLQLNFLTLGKSLQVLVPVSSSVKCRGRGEIDSHDLFLRHKTTSFSIRSSEWWRWNT